MQDRLQKAKRIVAVLLVDKLFSNLENRTHSDILNMLHKINGELELGIYPEVVMLTMIREGLIKQGGTYNGEPYYATVPAKQFMQL